MSITSHQYRCRLGCLLVSLMCFASFVVGVGGLRVKCEPSAVVIQGGDQGAATGEGRGLESHVSPPEEVGVTGTSVAPLISGVVLDVRFIIGVFCSDFWLNVAMGDGF